MFEGILLLDAQRDLLVQLVEASRRQSSNDRRPFLLVMTNDGEDIIHNRLPGGSLRSSEEDVEVLAGNGLISAKRPQKYTISFYVTPQGFVYYDELRTRDLEPVRRAEADLRELFDSESFKARYPEAHKKWTAAQELLWRNSDGSLSTIGHLCREAMQEFATALVERFKPRDPSPTKSQDVSRLKAVVSAQERRLGTTRSGFMEALINYWGALADMVQRQEHAGAKEGEAVTWEDARSIILHTLVLFAEFDRSLL